MNPMDQAEAQREREVAENRERKLRQQQMRRDVQAVFAEPHARRVLAAFLAQCNFDESATRLDPIAMANAATWHDAGRWWLQQLREHCPEREAQLRKESREAQPTAAQDDEA